MRPTLSAVVINYNHGHYIDQCIQSLLRQTRCPDEIVIVDDASTDNSQEILEKFRTHPKIRIFRNETNLGAERAVNVGFGLATSTYVFGLAADDYPLVNFVERCLDAAEKNPGVGVICSIPTFQDEGRSALLTEPNVYLSRLFSPEDLIMAYSPSRLWVAGHASIVRRDLLVEAGGNLPALRWHSDWFALHSIGFRAGVFFINESLSVMRRSANSYSSVGKRKRSNRKKIIDEIARLLSGPFSDIRHLFLKSDLLNHFPYDKRRMIKKLHENGVSAVELDEYFGWSWRCPKRRIYLRFQFAVEAYLNLAESHVLFALPLEGFRRLGRIRNELSRRCGLSW